jgi:hypothetical protein
LTIDESTINRAKEADLNLSQVTQRALEDELDAPQYYFVNANQGRLPRDSNYADIYDLGVTATFGPDEYGELLRSIVPGDCILSYVSGVGIRAVGQVLAPWGGRTLKPGESLRVLPDDYEENEYHLQTRWLAVVSEDEAVTPEEFRHITGRQSIPRQTREHIDPQYHPELLAAVVKGRSF